MRKSVFFGGATGLPVLPPMVTIPVSTPLARCPVPAETCRIGRPVGEPEADSHRALDAGAAFSACRSAGARG